MPSSTTSVININRCTLCQPIRLDSIATTGITLPLAPHLAAWQNGMDSQSLCGLCALIYHSLRHRVNGQMNILLLRYNAFAGAVVVIATTRKFMSESILPALVCGYGGEDWSLGAHKHKLQFACAFLSVNLGVGM
jgi:hypothetical protein